MNIQRLFQAVKEEPDRHTLITIAFELEQQGYNVTLDNRFNGSDEIMAAEEEGFFSSRPMNNGAVFATAKNGEEQTFRVHFLDDDCFCLTDIECLPVKFDENYTLDFFYKGKNN